MKDMDIMFKAKTVKDRKWVEGYFFKPKFHWHKFGIHEDWIITTGIQNGGFLNICGRYAIDKTTLCMYTGQYDYFENPIFTGDILETRSGRHKTFHVLFGDGAFYIREPGEYGVGIPLTIENIAWMMLEKVGNIND